MRSGKNRRTHAANVRRAFERQAQRGLHRLRDGEGRRDQQGGQQRSPRRPTGKEAAAGSQRQPADGVRRDRLALTPCVEWMTRFASASATRFAIPTCSAQALTHRSHGASNNERLEFLGDAVLNCVVAAALYARFPALAEGDLSRVRASLVNQDTLARVARGARARAARSASAKASYKTGGAARPSILADALEAVFGAVFLDGGFDAARAVLQASSATAGACRPRVARQGPQDAPAGVPAGAPHARCPSMAWSSTTGRGARAVIRRRMPRSRPRTIVAHRPRRQPPRRRAGCSRGGARANRSGGLRAWALRHSVAAMSRSSAGPTSASRRC